MHFLMFFNECQMSDMIVFQTNENIFFNITILKPFFNLLSNFNLEDTFWFCFQWPETLLNLWIKD
jgi:hypothetical protein